MKFYVLIKHIRFAYSTNTYWKTESLIKSKNVENNFYGIILKIKICWRKNKRDGEKDILKNETVQLIIKFKYLCENLDCLK